MTLLVVAGLETYIRVSSRTPERSFPPETLGPVVGNLGFPVPSTKAAIRDSGKASPTHGHRDSCLDAPTQNRTDQLGRWEQNGTVGRPLQVYVDNNSFALNLVIKAISIRFLLVIFVSGAFCTSVSKRKVGVEGAGYLSHTDDNVSRLFSCTEVDCSVSSEFAVFASFFVDCSCNIETKDSLTG
nr:hypothetical protein Iba_chr15fCG1400 [Ipomoea batatas]